MKRWLLHAGACSLLSLLLFSAGVERQARAGPGLINGAGATFPYPIYTKWFEEYHRLHPDIRINYQSIGSGGGIRQLLAGTVDFGASDMPMSNDQLAQSKIKILHFPTVLGAVVATYNVPEVKTQLKFTGSALAGIMIGRITKWNDPELAKANPGVSLPASDIVVVHRAEASGTTFVWTDYLSKVSSEWKTKVGPAINWPVGLGAKGNEGVSGLVQQTPYSVGYVELVYALQNKLSYGVVQNAVGSFVKADLKSVTAAAASAASNMPADFRVSITNPPGRDAYPIASFTWLLVYSNMPDAAKRDAITGFLRWMLSDGQKMVEPLGYAPLPHEVPSKELAAIATIR